MATRSPPPYTVVDTIAWAFWGALAVIYHVVFVARALSAARGEGFALREENKRRSMAGETWACGARHSES